ncbi:Mur ligase family protein [Anaerovorax odorimutans]|uniref:Mur ligase family protein n=1 Tax=Anaerovorax odorimutans TaxID=109327 RepID=UPI00040244ED|nr:UDP-N-acetylmuramoyl-L-alanyl-D-glutamate--2,6-diaminopimelate ligase [Anaerovorax odorimutans]
MVEKVHDLDEYLKILTENNLVSNTNINSENCNSKVEYISFNSNDIKNNTLFVCKGVHFSIEYLKSAIEKGATCYLSDKMYDLEDLESELDKNICYILVNDIRKAMAILADYFYNKSWENINLIGITGTKGKSTTSYFMKFILDDYLRGHKKPVSAILSGIDNYDGVINEESHLTTPEAMELHKHFYNAAKSGIEYLTMEVSSQALKYDRTLGINFDVACFLNIGEDHISDVEHSDVEDYFQSKLILFNQCEMACINLNSDRSEEVIAASKNCKKVVTFGLTDQADVYGYDIVKEGKIISFKVRTDSFDREFKLTMPGLFNVQNALAAIAISYCLDIPLEYIASGLKKARVSGRMEVYSSKSRNLQVIVDYAHNKMSFETLFRSTKKEYPNKKIIIVFGCPGKKAFGRRQELGEVAGKYSDRVYITEEDAGEEPVLKICEEIAKHVLKQNCKCDIIVDREEAIKQAISGADENTIVLITGKGRETRQKRGTKYIDCPSDVEYVQKYLEP